MSGDEVIEIVKEPVYQQLSKALKAKITNGEFKLGDKFFTERAISEKFSVSRPTANKALASLISEGILEYRQGRGTFIKGASLTHELGQFMSTTTRIKSAGMEPSTKVLYFKEIEAAAMSREAKEHLPVDSEEKVYSFTRVRFANDIPVMIDKHYFRKKFMPGLTKQKVFGSLFSLITEEYRLSFLGYDEFILSGLVRGKNAELLDVADGTAGFVIYNVGYIAGNFPLYFTRELCSHHVYEFQNHLRLDQKQRPIGRVFKQF